MQAPIPAGGKPITYTSERVKNVVLYLTQDYYTFDDFQHQLNKEAFAFL
jgi:hypothetical protein